MYAVSRSCGCAAAAKPKSDGRPSVISVKLLPPSLDTYAPIGAYVSSDGGKSFTEITEGLPSDFGFAAAAHPHDRDTAYMIPLDPQHGRYMHDGHAAVWMTKDAGSSWQKLDQGLPSEGAYLGVLREGMSMDSLDTPGVYFGSSTGQVFASADEGASWTQIADYLPGITSVEAVLVD